MIGEDKVLKLIANLREVFDCHEMQHAFRFNGVVDVYKKGDMVYNKKENTYNKFLSVEDMEMCVMEILRKYPPEGFYEVKGKPTYKDLKRKILPVADNKLDSFRPADYHWEQNISETSDDHLYFLFHAGFVKIGRSKNMQSRIKQLKTSLSCDYECFLIEGKGFMEKKMHHIFEDFRENGEWFSDDVSIRLFINKRLKDKTGYLFKEKFKLK